MPTKQKIPVVYVAGPYRAATRELIAENIAVARSVAVATARLGWFPLCPHTNTAHFDDDLPDQDQFFLDGTLALMARCDAVVLINGWRYSAGTLGEVHRARELGIPIFACLEDLPTAHEFAGSAAKNCAECQGAGYCWLAGASAHPSNRFVCGSCKGTGRQSGIDAPSSVNAHDLVTRNVTTRKGFEYWDKICSLKHYGFLHSPDSKRVVKTEGIGNWIDKFEAQEIVDQAQDEINQCRAERDALQQRLTEADERADSFDRLYTSSLDERDQLQQRADVLEGLLLQTNELLYAIQGDPGAVPSSSIDSMRGRVFEALKRDRSTSVLHPQNL